MNSSTCKGNRFEKNWMDQWGKRGNSSLWNQYSSYRSFCVSHTPSVIHRTSLHFCSYPRCSYFFFCRSYDVPVAPDSSLSAESSSPPSTHTNCPLPELLLANDIHTQFTKLIMENILFVYMDAPEITSPTVQSFPNGIFSNVSYVYCG